jgi:hypothetical protein
VTNTNIIWSTLRPSVVPPRHKTARRTHDISITNRCSEHVARNISWETRAVTNSMELKATREAKSC